MTESIFDKYVGFRVECLRHREWVNAFGPYADLFKTLASAELEARKLRAEGLEHVRIQAVFA